MRLLSIATRAKLSGKYINWDKNYNDVWSILSAPLLRKGQHSQQKSVAIMSEHTIIWRGNIRTKPWMYGISPDKVSNFCWVIKHVCRLALSWWSTISFLFINYDLFFNYCFNRQLTLEWGTCTIVYDRRHLSCNQSWLPSVELHYLFSSVALCDVTMLTYRSC